MITYRRHLDNPAFVLRQQRLDIPNPENAWAALLILNRSQARASGGIVLSFLGPFERFGDLVDLDEANHGPTVGPTSRPDEPVSLSNLGDSFQS